MRCRKLQLRDREWVTKLLHKDGGLGCQYTFANQFLCQDIYLLTFRKFKRCLIRKSDETKEYVRYHFPFGEEKDRRNALKALARQCRNSGQRLLLYGVSDVGLSQLRELFSNRIRYEAIRANQNYIYRTQDLQMLEGHSYEAQRRLIRRFEEKGDWSFERITKENMQLVWDFNLRFLEERGKTDALMEEFYTFELAMKHYDQLKLEGELLKLNNEVVGFAIGEPLQTDMYLSLYEKALREIKGSYAMLIHGYASKRCKDYQYLNRAEDMGEPGLRKAKLLYAPTYLSDYYEAEILL